MGQYLIDILVLLIPAVVIVAVLGHNPESSTQPYSSTTFGASLGLAVLAGVYFTLLVASRGATVGMSALGMRVARAEDGGPLPLPRAALRATVFFVPTLAGFIPVVGVVLSLVALASFLSPLWDPRKQALHDKLGKALVVRT